jgi:hypothetical protein
MPTPVGVNKGGGMKRYGFVTEEHYGAERREYYLADEADAEICNLTGIIQSRDIDIGNYKYEMKEKDIEIARLRKALEFYANIDNWIGGKEKDMRYGDVPFPARVDGGYVAAEALAPEKEEGK